MDFFVKKRKALLVVSIFLFAFTGIHLVWAYIYSDGKFRGLPGGSIAIGIVDTVPNPLNPLEYGTGRTADLMYQFLFRGLIRYNPATEIYEGDIANCDLSDLQNVACVLREDALWSDGSTITIEDITATYQAFGETTTNKTLAGIFRKATVQKDESGTAGAFTVVSPELNPLILNALSFPIIRSDVIDQIKNGRIKQESFITSGPFTYTESVEDTEYGFHRISLTKNQHYNDTVWLDRLHLKIFPDALSLERGIDTVTVILPPNGQMIKTNSRFQAVDYTTYEFLGVFFQTNRIDNNIRHIIHKALGQAFKTQFPEMLTEHKAVSSFFLEGDAIIPDSQSGSMTLDTWLSDKGYQKKWVWLEQAHAISTTKTDGVVYPKLQYFSNGGGNAILYSDDPNANIRLTGNIPSTTERVSINGYTLREYSAGSTTFAYRISQENGTIVDGKNEYRLVLTLRDGSTREEMLTIYHSTNSDTLAGYQQEVEQELLAGDNTEEKIAEREAAKNEHIAKIEALANTWYYNQDLEPFTLTIAYAENISGVDMYMEIITWTIEWLGISVQAQSLALADLEEILKTGKKPYDMLFIGVEAPENIARLGRTFHSSESGVGVNFSNIESATLDTLFAKLRSTTERTEALSIQSEITTLMKDLSFFLPVSSPKYVFYIDRDIKGLSMIPVIPHTTTLSSILKNVSIKDEYRISWSEKSFGGFFAWLGRNF